MKKSNVVSISEINNDFTKKKLLTSYIFREIREYKSRVESYSREMLRKEAQVRDLTQRLENGEGSKLKFSRNYFFQKSSNYIFLKRENHQFFSITKNANIQ